MAQVTWRAPDELVERVQHLAAADGLSMNAFLSRVLALAIESDEDDPLAARLRNRLRAAGLLAEGMPRSERPNALAFQRAQASAGAGVAVADLVSALRE